MSNSRDNNASPYTLSFILPALFLPSTPSHTVQSLPNRALICPISTILSYYQHWTELTWGWSKIRLSISQVLVVMENMHFWWSCLSIFLRDFQAHKLLRMPNRKFSRREDYRVSDSNTHTLDAWSTRKKSTPLDCESLFIFRNWVFPGGI